MSDIESKVKAVIADKLSKKVDEIKNEASLTDDLGADSLDFVELSMELETEFGVTIPEEDNEKLQTVQSIIDYITEKTA